MSATATGRLGRITLSLALPLALGLTACANDDSGPGAAKESAAPTTIDAALAKTVSGTTGTGKATGTAITLGLINQQGGPVSNPEFTVAAQAAVAYLNTELGGVGGHPLKLATCDIVSAESQGQRCGQQMLADDNVKLIVQGGLNVGTQSLHATLAGKKPDLVAVANPGPDVTAGNTYALNASSLAGKASTPIFLSDKLKAKTVAMIADDNPGNQEIAKSIKQGIEARGITVKLTTYPSGSADLLSPMQAVGAGGVDAIMPIAVTPTACIAMAKAYQQAAIKTPLLSSGLCASGAVKKALGDLPKWIFSGSMLNTNAPDPSGHVALYKAVMARYAPKGAEPGINAPAGFSSIFAAAKILTKAGPGALTTAKIADAAKAYTGPLLMGPPTLKFGAITQFPTLGAQAARYYSYEGDGKWVDASGGWINLPA
ncbi:ABC transporter substrate-binding protein [Actinomadura opuntiae]|uniref:ABC transporter substrate-binding protein n=1 Tax=Actinomadura sp. OS1-43 TaxID=604315 RepID=UPI00255B1FF1|nr:ABC transporter substrate-binding protein [Actinomadura sp. OS1-43]MDL4821094.1 ABC transporter substrate-binding protein [Actinomadura sp. OS1-43]